MRPGNLVIIGSTRDSNLTTSVAALMAQSMMVFVMGIARLPKSFAEIAVASTVAILERSTPRAISSEAFLSLRISIPPSFSPAVTSTILPSP